MTTIGGSVLIDSPPIAPFGTFHVSFSGMFVGTCMGDWCVFLWEGQVNAIIVRASDYGRSNRTNCLLNDQCQQQGEARCHGTMHHLPCYARLACSSAIPVQDRVCLDRVKI